MNDTVRWLWKIPGKKKVYVLMLTILQTAVGIAGVLYALLLRNVVDSAVDKDSDRFGRSIFLFVFFILIHLMLLYLVRWMNEQSKCEIENSFKLRLTGNIMCKDYARVCFTHTAEWMNRLTNDTVVVSNGYTEIIPGLCGTVVKLMSALILVILIDMKLACILIPGGILAIVFSYVFRKKLKKLHKDIQEKDGELRISMQENISSLLVIKSFANERHAISTMADKMEEHKSSRMKRNVFSNVCNTGFGALMYGIYAAGVIYCAHGILVETVTYGTLTAVIQLIGQVQSPFANISGFMPRWYAMLASAERLMQAETYAVDDASMAMEEAKRYYDEYFRYLEFEDVSFGYEPAEKNGEEASVVLKHFSLKVNKGEYVALVGHSGCGKTTILKLLMSLYKPCSGEIKIDENEISGFYRRLFAYVPQGNMLMNGTIRDIVSMAEPEAKMDETRIMRALSISCANEFVDDIDLVLGERGAGLSEGQMQRISIARAVFSDSPILLLDEATSALDETTEKRLLENLRRMTDKTVLFVTHRKTALEICDKIIDIPEEKYSNA